MVGIYKITHSASEKCYIGKSNDVERRLNTYRKSPYKIHNDYLRNAIHKHGLESFAFEVIEEVTEEKLNEREIFFIAYFESTNPEKGYNIKIGGQGGPIPPYVKEKISKALKGRPLSYKRTPEQCKAISERLMGHSLSENGRKKMSQSKKGVPMPRKRTPEQCKAISDRLKGHPVSEETKKKISDTKRKKKESNNGNS